ncbi:sensor histidine kinase [Photobacterium sp. WH24]|uniref:ATP-binding protein n=1 Tax=Photobacterium sp. WH24 TaxID=2827237 RepID=UPI001C44DCD3|nr:ATP-binding protein [Photobacterium sp. WH24]MBV7262852.1 sensor histidine kinase [Photobacterium sp. WH24]
MTAESKEKKFHFKAQARTVDHLGRGQIADAPTAVSELWKNSYDAYARDVALHLFDGDIKCGAIIDNGCGMTFDQLSNNWLTIGTASKAKKQLLNDEDRFGLENRFTQGEKGIGRLSTAFLAPVTLIVTKKTNSSYTAALIDWRLFENTYLALHEIEVPIQEFDSLSELPELCQSLQADLLDNFSNSAAWVDFSTDEEDEFNKHIKSNAGSSFISTQNKIQNFCKEFQFKEKFLSSWDKILNKVPEEDGGVHGTALFLFDLNRDLELLTNRGDLDRDAEEYKAIEKDLVDTLRAFVDPFNRNVDNEGFEDEYNERAQKEDKYTFRYEIKAFDNTNQNSGNVRDILLYKDVFKYHEFSQLEHKVEGVVDEKGWFRGSITAFGVVYPHVNIPCRSSGMAALTKTGLFGIQMGTFELEASKSTHDKTKIDELKEQAEKYSGLMIFRDGLRVLPYGRVDNDFFEIEERRGKNAGRYHWASRRIFGKISLHQEQNQRLKDKAGREGFIINQAARELKTLVKNLLIILADKYFGGKSDNRQVMLEQLEKDKKKQKKAQRSSAKINLTNFTNALSINEPMLNEQVQLAKKLQKELDSDIQISLNNLDEIINKVDLIESLRTNLKTPNKPAKLSDSIENQYRTYRDLFAELSELLQTCRQRLNQLEVQSQRFSPIQSADKKYKSSEAALTRMVNRYNGTIKSKLNDVNKFWEQEARNDRKAYESEALLVLDGVTEMSDAVQVLNTLDSIYTSLADDMSYKYESFLQALDKLEQGIDLESAFGIAEEERANAEQEVNQIRSLAQLGISFEVLAHELHDQDQAITRSLNSMSSDAKQQIGFKNAMKAHRQFTEYLRFLSPLKLSGYQSRDEISGKEIIKNIEVFFRDRFIRQNVELVIGEAFKRMTVVDVPSRIHPVFINILNNALYWVGLAESRLIKIDIIDDLVVIANSGPAVDQDDIKRLFELFYSRRSNGNGVGLYLSKQNLSVARHKIWYAENLEHKLIQDGANFVIQFRGMEIK